MNHIAAISQPGQIVNAAPKRPVIAVDAAPAPAEATPRPAAEGGRLERVWVPNESGSPTAVWRLVPASPPATADEDR